MAEKLNHDTELCEKLIPKFEVGCRRITPGEGYLESFLRPNVHLTQSPITKVTNSGIQTADGNFHEVDISMALSAPRLQNLVNVG
jgi:cation diffusion facilitator CzcD-associated flavoprotein CzcO